MHDSRPNPDFFGPSVFMRPRSKALMSMYCEPVPSRSGIRKGLIVDAKSERPHVVRSRCQPGNQDTRRFLAGRGFALKWQGAGVGFGTTKPAHEETSGPRSR